MYERVSLFIWACSALAATGFDKRSNAWCGPSGHPLKTSSVMYQVSYVSKLNTKLIKSIPGGDIANMKRLMAMGANPNATCRLNHVSACHIAVMHNNDALDLLLRSGADSSRSDKQDRTPLQLAAWAGNVKQIALLLNPPEDARYVSLERKARGREKRNVEDRKGISLNAVHVVVMPHSVPENNLDISPSQSYEESSLSDWWCDGLKHNCRNVLEQMPPFQQGWTALHVASARAHHHCVEMLLAVGADARVQDQLRRTPLDVAGCAHYMGHNIDVNNLMKTVNLLLKAGGKFLNHCDEKNPLDTPLHTAVELESVVAVEQMMQGGASATIWNSQGLTAMHVCVQKRNKKLLQLLANHKCNDEDPYLATVDVKDRSGSTVLCAAVKAEWIEGVYLALGAGALIIFKAKEETPIHIAAKLGNIDILQKILNIAKMTNIDYCNEEGETALFKAISSNHLDVVKFLLERGSSIEVENLDKANVFHVAAKNGRKEILEYLLNEYDSNITKILINRSDRCGPPLYYAVESNNLDCAELLIIAGAEINAKCIKGDHKQHQLDPSTLSIHSIIKEDRSTIHGSSCELGWTPLHEACNHGYKTMIELLLRNGADLSSSVNVNESYFTAKPAPVVPIDLLMNNISKPTEFLEEIFDSYITSEGQESRKVKVDHKILLSKTGMQHMEVIKALINSGNRYDQQRLLLHPLVQSFVYPKWKSLLSFFYCTLVLHVCFVLSLNVFTVSLFWYKDRKIEPVPSIFLCSVWIYIIYITAGLLTIQEIIVSNIKSKKYFLCLETSVKWLSSVLAVILPHIVSWDSKHDPEWARLFTSATLLLTWLRMMFLFSRLPRYGYYFLMYGKVAIKVFKIFLSFAFLIFGFGVSFMIHFHAQPPFEGPWASFLTMIVMMTSELGYNELINAEHAKDAFALFFMRLIFVSFLVVVSVILMNLLIGVAVNDVSTLESIGYINRLEKQVQFITSFEDIGCNNLIKKILPENLHKKWFENTTCRKSILVSLDPKENDYRLPDRLREAIFDNAQSQRKQLDDKRGTKLFQMKLDKIYKVTVEKDGTEPPKSEGPDDEMMRKLDEILKLLSKLSNQTLNQQGQRRHPH